MTTTSEVVASTPAPIPLGHRPDRRGSWIPTWGMIATRCMELRKRRGLMVALVVVTIAIPAVFLVIRLVAHAIAPKSFGPAGGDAIFNALVAGVLYVFGFIVAATLGCTAGSVDLTEGMFRHLVVTGRSRLALYLARIPAGLAIVVPLVAIGFTIVCAVCVFAAPTQVDYQGTNVPPDSRSPVSSTGPPTMPTKWSAASRSACPAPAPWATSSVPSRATDPVAAPASSVRDPRGPPRPRHRR